MCQIGSLMIDCKLHFQDNHIQAFDDFVSTAPCITTQYQINIIWFIEPTLHLHPSPPTSFIVKGW